MALSNEKRQELETLCHQFRTDVISTLHAIQTGHPGGSLSVCEILTAIYFVCADMDGKNPKKDMRDKVVMCKGHAAPMLYRIMAERSYFPKEDLKTLRQIGSHLQGHPSPSHTPGIESPTGPLGIGYPVALGMAMSNRVNGFNNSYVYAILGDGECNEGVVWEAAMSASKFKADGLITIVDLNGVQLDGTCEEVMPMGDMAAKWKAFGYHTLEIDGHNIEAVCSAIEMAKTIKGKPTVIIAKTVKGKGISFMEGKNIWHGRAINDEEFKLAMKELGGEANV